MTARIAARTGERGADIRQHEQAADHQDEAAAMLRLRRTIERKAYRGSWAEAAIVRHYRHVSAAILCIM